MKTITLTDIAEIHEALGRPDKAEAYRDLATCAQGPDLALEDRRNRASAESLNAGKRERP